MPETDVTRLLARIEKKGGQAAEELLPIVYDELRRLAAHHLKQEHPGQTLQATALVHEVYLKLVGCENLRWSDHRHFFAVAAESMRRILIDRARRKRRLRHGGGRNRFEFDDADLTVDAPPDGLIDLDAALSKLAAEDASKAEIVKLKYFGGLTLEQAAEVLGLSRATASRYWTYAKAWLYAELNA